MLGDACRLYYENCLALGKKREAEANLLEALKRAEDAQRAETAIFDRSRTLSYLLEQTADLYHSTDRTGEALVENQRVLDCAEPWFPIEGYNTKVQGNIQRRAQATDIH